MASPWSRKSAREVLAKAGTLGHEVCDNEGLPHENSWLSFGVLGMLASTARHHGCSTERAGRI
jgi:hypothetical protein